MLPRLSKLSGLVLLPSIVFFFAGCAAAPPPEVEIAPYQAEIERLNQMVEEQREEMDRLSASVDALSTMVEKSPRKKKKEAEKKPLPLAPPAPADADAEAEATGTPTAKKDPMAELYLRGLRFYEAKEYGETISVMGRFVKLAPTHVYADRAQYLLVDAYFLSGEYAQVLRETKDFEAKYPYSFRLADVLYKRGLAYQKMGQNEYAASHFDQVVKRFPDAEVASAAQQARVPATP